MDVIGTTCTNGSCLSLVNQIWNLMVFCIYITLCRVLLTCTHVGHDGSLRFWGMDSKTCVQVILAHRKRYDESVYSVCCHLSLPYFASAGADSIAKVFE